MRRFILIAGSAVGLASLAAPAVSQTILDTPGCSGELTIERLSAPSCIGRIPVPTPRPGENAASTAGKQGRLASVVYVEAPRADGQGTHRIRLIGPRYLPNSASGLDLRRPVTFASDPLNAVFYSVAGLLVHGDENTAVARDDHKDAADAPVLEARANLAERMASN